MRKKMLILSFLTLNMIGIFIFVGLNGFDEYALKKSFFTNCGYYYSSYLYRCFNSDFSNFMQ